MICRTRHNDDTFVELLHLCFALLLITPHLGNWKISKQQGCSYVAFIDSSKDYRSTACWMIWEVWHSFWGMSYAHCLGRPCRDSEMWNCDRGTVLFLLFASGVNLNNRSCSFTSISFLTNYIQKMIYAKL